MNLPPESPMVSFSNPPIPWSEAMVNAMTKPAPSTFADLAHNPSANITTGLGWIFAFSALGSVLSVILGLILGASSNLSTSGISTSAAGVSRLCIAPLAGILSVIGFVISTGLQNIIAKAIGGTGTYEQLVYAEAAFTAPIGVITSILSVIPVVNLLNLPLALYRLVLSASAIKGVHNFGWGKAVAALIVIPIFLTILIAVAIVLLLAVSGPAIGNIFSNIQRGL